jgi:hypothetical protein
MAQAPNPTHIRNNDTKMVEQSHDLLISIMKEVSNQSEDWEELFVELKELVKPINTSVPRWKNSEATAFESLLHYNLDLAFRQNAKGVDTRLSMIYSWLENKYKYQTELASKVCDLKVACSQLAATHKGSLDPDTEDPIGVLRDALLSFNPKAAKVILRELIKSNQYSYQHVKTNNNAIILALNEYINSDRYEIWPLDTADATCGAVSNHYKDAGWWRN